MTSVEIKAIWNRNIDLNIQNNNAKPLLWGNGCKAINRKVKVVLLRFAVNLWFCTLIYIVDCELKAVIKGKKGAGMQFDNVNEVSMLCPIGLL